MCYRKGQRILGALPWYVFGAQNFPKMPRVFGRKLPALFGGDYEGMMVVNNIW